MKERVTTQLGTNNVVLVAPHAHYLDDTNTDIIALEAASALDAYAIINNDWKRSKIVDELAGQANCNDITHCKAPVVKAEFLDPIYSAIDGISLNGNASFIMNNGIECYVFMIHGIGNSVRKKAKDNTLDLIVGFGAGKTPFYTCQEWQRDLFMDLCRVSPINWNTYAGAPGGEYSARSQHNLTQAIFRETGQPTMQLEFIYERRRNDDLAKKTGQELAKVIATFLKFSSYQRSAGIAVPPEI